MIPLNIKQDIPILNMSHPFIQLFLYYAASLCPHVIVDFSEVLSANASLYVKAEMHYEREDCIESLCFAP
jgi:hypothetical protein